MEDSPSSPSKHKKEPASFLMGFTAFASKAFSDTESAMSPTSILDTKPFSALKNPFWTEPTTPKPSPTPPKFNGDEVVGLRIVDSFTDDADNDAAKKHENSKFALLKIQIPALNNTFSVDSPKSPMEFGIKTRNSQLGLLISPKSSSGSPNLGTFPSVEMELSEDYTCIISRGGHVTKMTRIFDDCVVDSCFGEPAMSSSSSPPNQFESFLSFCHTCRKSLGHGDDIFMYRGEKAFCSDECRQREMLMEERLEKQGALGEDDFGSW